MPRELLYNFSSAVDLTAGLGQTFTLALTREVLRDVGKVTVKYYLNGTPIEPDALPDSVVGIMRSTVVAVPMGDSSSSQRHMRYLLAYPEAVSYVDNPRNLEAPWKPVYRLILLEVIHNLDTCDVLEEMPIWIFHDARDRMPLNATVSMPRGSGKTVFPDLSVVLRRSTPNMQTPHPNRFLPVLCELKRAISRQLTVNGYPDPKQPAAMNRLADSFSVAQKQLELTAYLHLLYCTHQTHIVLIVAVGPWFRGVLATRDDILDSPIKGCPEHEVARKINEVLEVQDGEDDVDDPPNEFEVKFPNSRPDANFKASVGVHFDDLSEIDGWVGPFILGSPEAVAFWTSVQATVHIMLSGGSPTRA